MAEPEDVRRALGELPVGTPGVTLQLHSGESVKGLFAGFDGEVARVGTAEGERRITATSISGVLIDVASEGPE